MSSAEYYFDYKDCGLDNVLQKQFEVGTEIIRNLIELGIENGEFVCAYPELEAKNMMYAIEGLKIMGQTTDLEADELDREMAYLLTRISVEQ